MPRLKTLLGIVLIFGLFYMTQISLAENEILLQEEDISISTVPENPRPYEDVTVTLVSFSTDLNKALIQWQNGSNTVLSGYGKIRYTFKTLGPNTNIILNVSITPAGSIESITKRVVISPSDIELIWESLDSYTPPFYRGKSFPSAESLIKVVAIPNTNTIKQGKGSIAYKWKEGDNSVLSASGYNKDSYVFRNSELNNEEQITVTAESVDGQYNATNTINIPIISPKVVFYKKSPTEGVLYNQAYTNETFMADDEITLSAVPYFLAIKGKEDIFSYTWKINGKEIETPTKKTELTIRPASRGGYATIDLTLENLNTLYQKVSGKIKLNL